MILIQEELFRWLTLKTGPYLKEIILIRYLGLSKIYRPAHFVFQLLEEQGYLNFPKTCTCTFYVLFFIIVRWLGLNQYNNLCGLQADIETIKIAVCSAINVMQALGSSLHSLLSRVRLVLFVSRLFCRPSMPWKCPSMCLNLIKY